MTLPPILHEDDALIAFDKPAGLRVAPDRWDRAGDTLMDRVQARLGRQIASAHRLEAEASGVVLCAKTKPALDFLSGQFQAKQVEKSYFALVAVLPVDAASCRVSSVEKRRDAASTFRAPHGGLSAEFVVDLALEEDKAHPGRMRALRKRGGKPSTTNFRVLESFGRFAWLECRLLTGSRHQIRVHLAAAGAPVLNDVLYGDPGEKLLLSELKRRYKGRAGERPLIDRLALHAGELGFLHPATRLPLTVKAPLPNEFEVALKYLRKFGFRAPGARGGRCPPS